MKKIVSFVIVLVLCLSMAPMAFADVPWYPCYPCYPSYPGYPYPSYPGYPCYGQFYDPNGGVHISNGNGTHSTHTVYGPWCGRIDQCTSDNNKNGKCDYCGYVMAALEPMTVGTPVELSKDMLGNVDPGKGNVSVRFDDESIATAEIVDGVIKITPKAAGETYIRLFIRNAESRVMKLTVK